MSDVSRPVPPITVVIADDEPAVADYLALTLSLEDGDFEIVGVVGDAAGVVEAVGANEPDVLLLDLHMPGGGVEAAQLVSVLFPATRVLVFTADADATDLLVLLRSGISGYLTKSASSEEVVAAVRAVAAGKRLFADDVAAKAIGELTDRLHTERSDELRTEKILQRIESVISRRAFTIVCQPIVDLRTGTPCGVETLTRFTGPPERSPDKWFEEAASVNRLIDLELVTAGAALDLLDELAEPLWLSVNLSPATVLSGGLGALLLGRDLARVVIELTEHAPVEDYGFLNHALDQWRAKGLRLAVDDTGGGYASFAHVIQTQPNFIKLDRSLVHHIDTDVRKQALAKAVTEFAVKVGIDLIAEGIEIESEREQLRTLGARYGQGFHIGRPASLGNQPTLVIHT